MIWVATILFCFVLVEVALRLPFGNALSALTRSTQRASRTMASRRISDHWKEKAIGAYAGRTFRASGTLAVLILGLAAVAAAFAWVLGAILGRDLFAFLLTLPGLLLSAFVASLYAWMRMRRAPSEGYSATDRLLHRLALGRPAIAEMSFDMDQARGGLDIAGVTAARHVFVAGLARAGTTVLMRRFHASGAFRSLTYRDMPFVLAPRLWASVSGASRRATAVTERAHGDSLTVSADSPEALDEVFWRVFEGESYIQPDRLVPHRVGTDLVSKFRRYVAAVLGGTGASRYLSKNNNNILRLGTIRAAFPNALILIPFRNPADHAGSLLSQHVRFEGLHRDDPFAQSYMTWLAHHEFGSDHRPFVMAGDRPAGSPLSVEYWLTIWCDVYEWLLETAPEDAVFVSYEALCDDPNVWNRLANAASVPVETISDGGFKRSRSTYELAEDDVLRARAGDILSRLLQRSERDGD